MAQLCLSLSDCRKLLKQLEKLDREGKIFKDAPTSAEHAMHLTRCAYPIVKILTEIFILDELTYDTKCSDKQIKNIIEILNQIIPMMD